LGTLPVAKLGENALSFAQGSRLAALGQGIHAPLDVATSSLKTPATLPFSIAMSLGGTERLGFVPLGDQNSLALTSPWPHPQFGGQFLPRSREISDSGFSAKWAINALATQAQAQLQSSEKQGIDTINVALIDPVNVYLQAERAIKYGILFIGLTFAAFFFFETVKALPVHPIQYGLVGLALVMFFLLLVALSEHLTFYISYLIACGCCISTITIYLIAVMKSRARGLGFGAGLVALYAALYGLLISEQNALVLGALMLFLIVAGIMIGTRHVNWFAIAGSPAAPKATPPAPPLTAAVIASAGVGG
jgi:inner membrane protein